MDQNPLPSLRFRLGTFVGVIICVLGIQISLYFVAVAHIPTWQERGQFGDLFGVANAFFSGSAFAGLVYTIILQQEQLKQQARYAASAHEETREIALAHQKTVNLGLANLLVEHYRRRLTEIERGRQQGPSAAAAESERKAISEKLCELEKVLRDAHREVVTGLGG